MLTFDQPDAKRLVLVDGPDSVAPLKERELQDPKLWTVVHEAKADDVFLTVGLASVVAKVGRANVGELVGATFGGMSMVIGWGRGGGLRMVEWRE